MSNRPLQLQLDQDHEANARAARDSGTVAALSRLSNSLEMAEQKAAALEKALREALDRAESAEAALTESKKP